MEPYQLAYIDGGQIRFRVYVPVSAYERHRFGNHEHVRAHYRRIR